MRPIARSILIVSAVAGTIAAAGLQLGRAGEIVVGESVSADTIEPASTPEPPSVVVAPAVMPTTVVAPSVAVEPLRTEPLPSEPPRSEAVRADLGSIRDAVQAYRRQDLAAGDAIRARTGDARKGDTEAGTLLDWAAIRYGGSQVAFERIAAFSREHPNWPGAAWLRRRGEEQLLSERKPPETVRAYFSAERPQTAAGKLALALAFKAEGLAGDAASLVRDAWRNDNFSMETEARVLGGFPDLLTSADHRARMERQLLRENWEPARRAAGYAGKGYDALVKARTAVVQRAGNAAKLLDAVPPPLRTDLSYLFSRAQNLRRADKAADAAKLMADLTRDPALLVDGDAWWVERRLVARKLLDSGDAKLAYAVSAGHGAVAPEKRIEAEFQAGWIALRYLKDSSLGATHFERAAALAATPISIARTAYWRGRAAEDAGNEAAARGFFEQAARQGTTYYGQLAGAKLGWSQLAIRAPIDPASPERIAAARAPITGIVSLVYAAGLRDVALPLVTEISRSSLPLAELDAIGDVVLSFGDARALLILGKGATQRGLALDEEAFPTIGVPAFEAVGDRVEKAMIYAITRQESAFDPAAGSGVGARGLMQLMPATAQHVARKYGVEFDSARLLDGVYNARLGAAHLGELMGDWKGSYILTFASYNAGAGNVRKWIDAYGDPRKPEVDPVDWVERIPFAETRNYVQRVMENLQVYRKRLDARSALVIESDLKRGGVGR